MKIRLKTDYLDCYDHWFDREGDVVFSRVAKGSWELSRAAMFAAFDQLKLAHPKFASLSLASFAKEELVVVYVDPYAHQGEAKLLLSAGDAVRLYEVAALAADKRGLSRLGSAEVELLSEEFRPRGNGAPERGMTLAGKYASAYEADFPGSSWRLLSCGGHRSWFRHQSFDDWRSNAGDGDLYEILNGEDVGGGPDVELPSGFEERILNPVWAIDFVAKKEPSGKASLLAVDFNTAPRVAGTPLARRVSASALAEGVRTAVEKMNSAGTGPSLVNNNKLLLAKAD